MVDRKELLLLSVAVSALVCPAVASAQDTLPAAVTQMVSDGPSTGDEIVVTAQKREQRLLDVPISISAVTSEALTTQSLNRVQDYFDRIPGLQYSGQRVSSLSLRGITTGGQTGPTIAILVDDVQFGGTTGAGQPPIPDFDASAIERVEVLRGPQGTLYGAASLGGLIKYVLRQPDTRAFSGRLEAGGTTVAKGSEGYSLRGSINVPITDWLAVAGSAFYREDAPYLDNFRTGTKDTNDRKVWGFRGAVLLRPTNNLTITGSALKQNLTALNSDLQITSGGVPICKACTSEGTPASRSTAPTTFEPVYGDLTINSLDSPNESTFEIYSARAELALDNAKISSISAWSIADNVITGDLTATFPFVPPLYGSPAGAAVTLANSDRTTKFSQELRVEGSSGAIDWLAGAFYTVEHAATNQTIFLISSTGTPIATPFAGLGPTRYRELAGFADLTWHFTDKFEIQVGGRYAGNRQATTNANVIDAPAVPVFGPSGTQTSRSKDNAFTWLVSPTYHITRDMMVYARIASGYRPGGPNRAALAIGPYDADTVVNYELGFKGRVIPGILTIDTALFQIDWKDIQLQGISPNQLGFITNGGKARSRGLEFSANLTPWRGMTIDAALALTDAELTQTLPNVGTSSLQGLAGDKLPFTADVTGSLTAQQSFDLSERLEGSIGINFTYVGDRPGGFSQRNGTRPRVRIPEYETVNFTAGLKFEDAWSANLFLRNAFDKRGVAAAQNRNGTSVPTALFIQPRTLGLNVARSF